MAKGSKWGRYIGAPKAIDDAFTAGSFTEFKEIPRGGSKGIGGIHYIHHLAEYSAADEADGGYSATAAGQVIFTEQNVTVETVYGWVIPAGVNQISAVIIGGGGGGGGNNGYSGPGAAAGGGGGLAWGTWNVTPGENYEYEIGQGGQGGTRNSNPFNGGSSYFWKPTGDIAIYGGGGGQGWTNSNNSAGGGGGGFGGTENDGGGSGGQGGSATNNGAGSGGGGAGGYSGNGGSQNNNGSGGGGAGGANNNGYSSTYEVQCGGGTGLYGEGASGTAYGTALSKQGSRLGPASGVGFQRLPVQSSYNSWGGFGLFGSGGGGIEDDTGAYGHYGGSGGLRIIWGGGRSYPSTNTADV